jgi:hypothetical protein
VIYDDGLTLKGFSLILLESFVPFNLRRKAMRKHLLACCLLLLAVPVGAANLDCVDISLLKITPSSNPAKKQAIIQAECHCPEGGYNVEAGLYTGLAGNPTPWTQHITTNMSYFGPNQTAPAKLFFAYDPAGVVKFKVEIRHKGDLWGSKILSVPQPWQMVNPRVKKYEKKLTVPLRDIPKP